MIPDPADGIRQFLHDRGLDPDDQSIVDTPDRVLRAWAELTAGYDEDPADPLSKTFPTERDGGGIITLDRVPFTSLCEHHLMPFAGTATIAYLPLPGAPVVGLSKLARLLDIYARRLQIQERLTSQVTAALDKYLDTEGSACIIRAEHGCMSQRGVRKHGAVMITSSYTGRFRDDPTTRGELTALLHTGG